MGIFSGYVLSIVGVVLMFIVIELILPNGKNTKYIRSILGMFLIFVIIAPISKLKTLDFNDIIDNKYSYDLNYDYLYTVHLKESESLKSQILKKLEDEGISNPEILITIEKQSTTMQIIQIYVDLSQAVISPNSPHINNYTTLKKIISDIAGIEQSKVVIDE